MCLSLSRNMASSDTAVHASIEPGVKWSPKGERREPSHHHHKHKHTHAQSKWHKPMAVKTRQNQNWLEMHWMAFSLIRDIQFGAWNTSMDFFTYAMLAISMLLLVLYLTPSDSRQEHTEKDTLLKLFFWWWANVTSYHNIIDYVYVTLWIIWNIQSTSKQSN